MQIKILSLNLWEGGLLWDNILELFAREKPDIFCLQEANIGDDNQPSNFQTLRLLQDLYPDSEHYYSPELYQIWPDGSQCDTGNLILTHFPIRTKKTTFLHGAYEQITRDEAKGFSHYPKNMQSVEIQIQDKKLFVLNLHGVWGLDGNDNPERLHMGNVIIEESKNKQPLVLMGDFNLQPETQTVAQIEKHLTNIFKGEMETSFNMRHKTNPGYATAVVDMFFASQDVKILERRVLEDDVSDHKPLVVTIEI